MAHYSKTIKNAQSKQILAEIYRRPVPFRMSVSPVALKKRVELGRAPG
ncbi:MAG TPA: hypothetical protein PKI21_06075 [Nitrospira sp.]|nr:hypothetical protein [Nitrospira sp.]